MERDDLCINKCEQQTATVVRLVRPVRVPRHCLMSISSSEHQRIRIGNLLSLLAHLLTARSTVTFASVPTVGSCGLEFCDCLVAVGSRHHAALEQSKNRVYVDVTEESMPVDRIDSSGSDADECCVGSIMAIHSGGKTIKSGSACDTNVPSGMRGRSQQ